MKHLKESNIIVVLSTRDDNRAYSKLEPYYNKFRMFDTIKDVCTYHSFKEQNVYGYISKHGEWKKDLRLAEDDVLHIIPCTI